MSFTDVDPGIAEIEAEIEASSQRFAYPTFFFSLRKAGQKAHVRLLANLGQQVSLLFHEKYSKAAGYEVSAVCAKSYGFDDCAHCATFEKGEKKLKPQRRFYLPIYVFSVGQWDGQQRKWLPVTYVSQQDSQEHMVSGLRILELKGSSQVLADLLAQYNELDDHDLTQLDFIIERKTEGAQTKYTTTPKFPTAKSPRLDLPEGVEIPTKEKIKSDVELNRAMARLSSQSLGQDKEPLSGDLSEWTDVDFGEEFP